MGRGSGRRRGVRGSANALIATILAALATGPPAILAQWTQDPGEAWTGIALYHHDTRERYGIGGEIEPFFADGHAVSNSLFLTTAIGILDGLDAWVQLSGHHLSFDDAAGERDRTGLGDARLYLRIAGELFDLETPIPMALRGGVKLPGDDFPVDPEIVPLSEGQVDWELMLELGESFWPTPLYVMGWVGYRWRGTHTRSARTPGDELFGYAAAGGDIGSRLSWKVALQGLWGRAPILEGVEVPTAKRRIIEVLPLLAVNAGPGAIELGARFPLAGRNLPSGPSLIFGYLTDWSLP